MAINAQTRTVHRILCCYFLVLYFTLLGFADQRFHLLDGAGSLIIAKAFIFVYMHGLNLYLQYICVANATPAPYVTRLVFECESNLCTFTPLLNELLHV